MKLCWYRWVWRAFFCPQKIWGEEGTGTAEVLAGKSSYERPKKFQRLNCFLFLSMRITKECEPPFPPESTSSLETFFVKLRWRLHAR